MSVRRPVGRHVDGDLLEIARSFERSSLPEEEKTLLRLTDSFNVAPAALPADVKRQLRAFFTLEQIVEAVYKLAWVRLNKSMLAVGEESAKELAGWEPKPWALRQEVWTEEDIIRNAAAWREERLGES